MLPSHFVTACNNIPTIQFLVNTFFKKTKKYFQDHINNQKLRWQLNQDRQTENVHKADNEQIQTLDDHEYKLHHKVESQTFQMYASVDFLNNHSASQLVFL